MQGLAELVQQPEAQATLLLAPDGFGPKTPRVYTNARGSLISNGYGVALPVDSDL